MGGPRPRPPIASRSLAAALSARRHSLKTRTSPKRSESRLWTSSRRKPSCRQSHCGDSPELRCSNRPSVKRTSLWRCTSFTVASGLCVCHRHRISTCRKTCAFQNEIMGNVHSPRLLRQGGNAGGQQQRHRQNRCSDILSDLSIHSILLNLVFDFLFDRFLLIHAARRLTGLRCCFFQPALEIQALSRCHARVLSDQKCVSVEHASNSRSSMLRRQCTRDELLLNSR